MSRPRCFFYDRGGCDGRYDRAHWIPKQAIKKAYPYGVMRRAYDGLIAGCARHEQYVSGGVLWEPVSLDVVVWDERCWSYMCRRHHGDFDNARFFISRDELPACVEEFAAEHFLTSRLDKQYGLRADHDRHLYA